MPARSVVIERLTKFGGERRELLTPGEYTQLTGRAGRRGIDEIGYAIVLWSPFVPFEQVASLASSRTYALRSAFRPTYNMAANLVRRYEPDEAHHLLNLSFAQFQADKAVVRLEARIERQQDGSPGCARRPTASAGTSRSTGACGPPPAVRAPTPGATAAGERRPHLRGAQPPGPGRRAWWSTAPRWRCSAWRSARATRGCTSSTSAASRARSAPTSCSEPPRPWAPSSSRSPTTPTTAPSSTRSARPCAGLGSAATVCLMDEAERRAWTKPFVAAEAHPVADCPDRDAHLRSAVQAERVARELDDLRRQVRGRTESLARRFDRVLRLLEAWGYLDGWALTASGEVLARTYHESDLLVAEAMTTGLLDDLDVPIAGRARVLLHLRAPRPRPPARARASRRRPCARGSSSCGGSPTSWPPTRRRPACRRPARPMPASCTSPTRGRRATAWPPCSRTRSCPGGDFVRNVKQLIDLLRGIGDVAPVPATAARARQAADALHRGVVTASSALEVDGDRRGSRLTIAKGEAWGAPGGLPRHGVVVRSDAEARAIVTAARRADEPIPPLGLLGGDLCRTLGGTGRRSPAALDGGHAAAGRPRRRAARRTAALVRRPPRGPARLVAGPGGGGHERPVPRRVGRRARGVTPTTGGSTCSTPTSRSTSASRCGPGSSPAPTCPTRASTSAT